MREKKRTNACTWLPEMGGINIQQYWVLVVIEEAGRKKKA